MSRLLINVNEAKLIEAKEMEFNQDFDCDEAYQPWVTHYNPIKKCVVHRVNHNYAALHKANCFKINNPPTFYIDDRPDVEWDDDNYKNIYIPRLNMILEIKLPINVFTYDGKKNLSITYLFEMDPEYKNTKRCYFYISHYYLETIKDNLKYLIHEYEYKLEKIRKSLYERNEPPILKYLNDYDKEEMSEHRLVRMIYVLKKNNPNFLKEKRQCLYYEHDIQLIETADIWW